MQMFMCWKNTEEELSWKRKASLQSSLCLNNLFFSPFTMQFYGALLLFLAVSTAGGLRCYTCTAADPKSCTDTKSCPVIFNRCFSLRVDGYNMVTKGCQTSIACHGAMKCCEGSLCNSAIPTGSNVILLLVSSAVITLFLWGSEILFFDVKISSNPVCTMEEK